MPKIVIDGREVECRERITVLRAALEAGWDIPHYCYHPGLSIVASCRLCLMQLKMPDPKTRELIWTPKLVPSCQTPVKDGLEVRFAAPEVQDNQRRCMEFFLLNHPLDCPVCDQAGECYLQDYSEKYGDSSSRMVDPKHKNPKKDIGSKTLLYADRCVLCSRCIRFCKEIAGTAELCSIQRGSRAEVDVFPGQPLENPLQGNVVDLCPVGALLDKDFLMKRRVWELTGTPSVCPGCAAGCAIRIDHADGKIYRLKPRYNPGVNDWWMCDEGRFGWKHTHDPRRLNRLTVRRGNDQTHPDWSALPEIVSTRLGQIVRRDGATKIAAVLSPFMACEEAWLLIKFIRGLAPEATLVMGPVPRTGEDQSFPVNGETPVRFTIHAEKCPNRRGIELILNNAGGRIASLEVFIKQANEGAFSAAWMVGGYPGEWVSKELAKAAEKIELLFVQDLFPSALTGLAAVVLPSCSWAERAGCFVNHQERIQPFEAALAPPGNQQRDGLYLFAVAGHRGLYNSARVREMMAREIPAFGAPHIAPEPPEHAH